MSYISTSSIQNLVNATPNVDFQIIYPTASQTTNSLTYVDVANSSITTKNLGANGRYLVIFSAGVKNSSNNADIFFRFVVDGIPVASSERQADSTTAGEPYLMTLADDGIIAASKVIKVQWKVDGGTATLNNGFLSVNGVNINKIIP